MVNSFLEHKISFLVKSLVLFFQEFLLVDKKLKYNYYKSIHINVLD